MDPKIYYAFIISFFLGIFARSFFENFLAEMLFILLLFCIVFIVFIFFRQKISKYFIFLFVAAIAFSLGVIRLEIFNQYNVGDFNHQLGQEIEKNLIVVDEPEKKGYHTKLILQFESSQSKAIM